MINIVQQNRDNLLDKTKNIEDYLNKILNESRLNAQLEIGRIENENLVFIQKNFQKGFNTNNLFS